MQVRNAVLLLVTGFAAMAVVAMLLINANIVDAKPASVMFKEHKQELATHIHFMIKGVEVPDRIGMDTDKWHDHSLDNLGANGLAVMHTHDASGQVHVESTEKRPFRLGLFFSIWGVTPSSVCLDMGGIYCQPLSDYASVIVHAGDVFKVEL